MVPKILDAKNNNTQFNAREAIQSVAEGIGGTLLKAASILDTFCTGLNLALQKEKKSEVCLAPPFSVPRYWIQNPDYTITRGIKEGQPMIFSVDLRPGIPIWVLRQFCKLKEAVMQNSGASKTTDCSCMNTLSYELLLPLCQSEQRAGTGSWP